VGPERDRILPPAQIEPGRPEIPDLHLIASHRGPGRWRAGRTLEVEGRPRMVRRLAHEVSTATQGERGRQGENRQEMGSHLTILGLAFNSGKILRCLSSETV